MLSDYGIINIWTYIVGTVIIILLPGPNSLFVLATSASRGVRVGYQAACGVFLGDSILMALTAGGAASVLRVLPVLFIALKVMGALYLCYLGARLIQSAWHQQPEAHHLEVGSSGSRFHKALLLSLLNPKAILFFLSFFVQFVDPAYAHPVVSFFILALILQAFSLIYLSVLIFGGARLASAFRRRPGLARLGSSLTGVLFLGFAAKLALEK
ncbi:leucine efflux protein LeuE [Alcaligenaceae bacterium CGII-47]|nr:leucine efflux protein LeuE [Alcaligenaceae bacterium CGII-47]